MNSFLGENKSKSFFVLILFLLFIVVYGFIFNSKLDMNGDNFGYLSLSKNIYDGHGYTNLTIDGIYKAAGWFPPGYPYILAISRFFVGDSIVGLKVVNGIFFLFSVLLFFLIVQKLTKNLFFAFSVAVLMLMNRGLLWHSTTLMSEIPYLFFVVLSVYSLLKFDENYLEKKMKQKWLYFLIISSVLSFYIRSVGIVLILAIIFHWLVAKKWKLSFAYIFSITILYLPYFIRNKIFGIKGRYLKIILVDNPWRPESGVVGSFGEFCNKIITNLNDTVICGFPKVLFPAINVAESATFLKVVGIIVLVLLFLGIWSLKTHKYFFGSFFIFNIGVFLLWHTGNGVRYVWPLTGFIIFFVLYGIYFIILKIFELKNRSINLKCLGLLFLPLALTYIPEIKKLNQQAEQPMHPAYSNYLKLADYIKKQDRESIVSCRKSGIFSHYSQGL